MKQVYKITYPNGKIYIGVDVTGTISYFGSPSDSARIEADLGTTRTDFSVRKTILWESDTASDRESRAMETKLIVEHLANDPQYGYNRVPRFRRDYE